MSRPRNDDISLGRFISLVLRHHPEAINITLDKEGWADTRELLDGINATGRRIDMTALERIVRENNKQRYSFNADKSKIRANQGHSIPVDIKMRQVTPPDRLYHGTSETNLPLIKESGIKKMSRLYVHLSYDVETAVTVGSRHGKPVVLIIDTAAMVKDGYTFMLSDNGVWQSQDIPFKYVTDIITDMESLR